MPPYSGTANVNARDGDGKTPLHVATFVTEKEIQKAKQRLYGQTLEELKEECVEVLKHAWNTSDQEVVNKWLSNSIYVNMKDELGNTALHWATQSVNKELVEKLILHGGDAFIKNQDGKIPLHYAIMKKDFDLIKLLLRDVGDDMTNERNEDPTDVQH
uniref:Myotrophin n=1 Tax=Ditylenchus dipsaci TaxID=166011 RepID=A0A915E7L9_9BILA